MIGIFDSGIGGLNVAKEIKISMPDSPILYFGDVARSPWGNKSPELVQKYSEQISEFLISQGAREIIIACNTASTLAADHLRNRFPEIKFHDVITPVLERITEEKKRNTNGTISVAIIGTRGTIENGVYERKLKKLNADIRILSRACPLFVPLAEEGMGEHAIVRAITAEYLSEIKKMDPDYLILGCTHYPLLEKSIRAYLGEKIEIISSAKEIARRLKVDVLPKDENQSGDSYFFSDLTGHYQELAAKIMGKEIKIDKILIS